MHPVYPAENDFCFSYTSRPASRLARQLIATRLTQRNKREVKGSDVPAVNQPKPEHVCGNCGVKIRSDKKFCSKCAKQATRVTFRAGRKVAQQPEYLAKRAATMHQHFLRRSSRAMRAPSLIIGSLQNLASLQITN